MSETTQEETTQEESQDLAPTIVDRENFVHNIEYITPLEKSSAWLMKRFALIYRRVEKLAPYYQGVAKRMPTGLLLSDLFEAEEFNSPLNKRLNHYGRTLCKYKPGKAPADLVSRDRQCAEYLYEIIKERLPSIAGRKTFLRAINGLWKSLTITEEEDKEEPGEKTNAKALAEDYKHNVVVAVDKLQKAFSKLSDSFAQMEDNLQHPPSPAPAPVTKTEVKAIVEAEGKATKQEVKAIVEKDGEATRKKLHREANVVKAHVTECTEGTYKGCHHPRAKMDAAVQEVVKYLAKPGNDGSIKNACRLTAKSHNVKFNTLYDWCREHKESLLKDAEILRAAM